MANMVAMFAEGEFMINIPVRKGYEAVEKVLTAHDFVLLGGEDGIYLYSGELHSEVVVALGEGGAITAVMYEKSELSQKEVNKLFKSLSEQAINKFGKPHVKQKGIDIAWFFSDYMYAISKEKGKVSVEWFKD